MRVKRTEVQRYQWAVVDAIDGKLTDIANQRSLLARCGLDKEADRLNAKIVELNERRKNLIDQIEKERRKLALYIPKILFLCDLLAQISSDFADEISAVCRCAEKNGFSQTIDENIHATRTCMKQWADAVLMIDEIDDQMLSSYYATISEEFIEHIGTAVDGFIEKLKKDSAFSGFFG